MVIGAAGAATTKGAIRKTYKRVAMKLYNITAVLKDN